MGYWRNVFFCFPKSFVLSYSCKKFRRDFSLCTNSVKRLLWHLGLCWHHQYRDKSTECSLIASLELAVSFNLSVSSSLPLSFFVWQWRSGLLGCFWLSDMVGISGPTFSWLAVWVTPRGQGWKRGGVGWGAQWSNFAAAAATTWTSGGCGLCEWRHEGQQGRAIFIAVCSFPSLYGPPSPRFQQSPSSTFLVSYLSPVTLTAVLTHSRHTPRLGVRVGRGHCDCKQCWRRSPRLAVWSAFTADDRYMVLRSLSLTVCPPTDINVVTIDAHNSQWEQWSPFFIHFLSATMICWSSVD